MNPPPMPLDIDLGDGRSLHALTAGSGHPIVLLHGAFTTHVDWLGGPLEALASMGAVAAIDRPGHGASLRRRFEGTPAQQAAQIHAGLAAMGLERPHLVGHSMGGIVALAYAAAYPEAVGGLLLLSPLCFPEVRPLEHTLLAPRSAPLLGPALAELGRWSVDPGMLGLAQRMMFAPEPVPSDWLARYPREQMLTVAQMVQEGEDAVGISPLSPGAWIDLNRVTAPLHIVAGTEDKIADPHRHARRLHRILPRSTLTMIEGAGHMVHHRRLDRVLDSARDLIAAAREQKAA